MPVPYWLNPDVLVHELAHHLLYGTLGFGPRLGPNTDGPAWAQLWLDESRSDPRASGDAFRAFHEGFADIAAMLVALHHDGFLHVVIAETKGDIFSVNALSCIGEVTRTKTIRNAMNNLRLADLAPLRPEDPVELGYYRLSQIVSGTLFDILAAFALRYLAAYGVLAPELVDAWDHEAATTSGAVPPEVKLRQAMEAIYDGPNGPSMIRHATLRARDGLGQLLGAYLARHAGGGFDPSTFTLRSLRDDLASIAAQQGSALLPGDQKSQIVAACFAWRGV
jgi:hypothetical protein